MEGPSLVIAVEELARFKKKKTSTGEVFLGAASWGKHLILRFDDRTLRIHFLMFGSYRIDDPRENRIPKLQLSFPGHEVYFYSCAIKAIDQRYRPLYDWTINVMGKEWDAAQARAKIRSKKTALVCDVLMDQSIFAGVGNIIKNEVLHRLRLHPETLCRDVPIAKLVKATEDYCWQFYHWKKADVLKRNWRIFRKKTCPECGGKVTKKPTGKLERMSHWCSKCQRKKTK